MFAIWIENATLAVHVICELCLPTLLLLHATSNLTIEEAIDIDLLSQWYHSSSDQQVFKVLTSIFHPNGTVRRPATDKYSEHMSSPSLFEGHQKKDVCLLLPISLNFFPQKRRHPFHFFIVFKRHRHVVNYQSRFFFSFGLPRFPLFLSPFAFYFEIIASSFSIFNLGLLH